MGGASSYLAILCICGFLSAAWFATKLSKLAGVSSIVLEITTGVILGPQVLGLISKEYATCEHKLYTDCSIPSDFSTRVSEGLSLGEHLDDIAHESCWSWAHGDAHADGHGDDTHGDSHGDDGHGGQIGDVDDGNTTEDGHDDGHSDSTTGHGTDHTESSTTHGDGHGEATTTSLMSGTQRSTTTRPSTTRRSTTTRGAGWDDEAESWRDYGGNDDNDGGFSRRLSGSGNGGKDFKSYDSCVRKSCEAHVAHECGLTPDVFTLIGHTGVALMIFESGMHFDFEKAQVVGPKACAVAVLGTILPLVTGTLLMVIYGYPLLPDGVSVGTALAPTSVGIALRLLGEAGVLQHDFGQAIITAAFVDDILSLVLFNVLFSLRGEFNVMATVVNPIIGIIFMGIAMVLAVKFWPKAINEYLLPRLPQRPGERKVAIEDEALFLVMMVLLVLYATITHFLGTHLWGCFIAGMSFACIDKEGHKGHTHHVWVRQTKRITSWMIRIFFACTVAFSIPVGKLLSISAFLKGSVMGIGPCVLTKVLCAPFMGSARFVIGWAMVGRAEFAYLIAQMAAAANMIDEDTFSICIWALLYATIFAPFIFRTVLNRFIEAEGIARGESVDVDAIGDESDEEVEAEAKTSGVADGHAETVAAPTKRKVDFDSHAPASIENTAFGKQFQDLEKINVAVEEGKGLVSVHGGSSGEAAPARRRLWFGRTSGSTVADSPNGFLCCLFFRRVMLS